MLSGQQLAGALSGFLIEAGDLRAPDPVSVHHSFVDARGPVVVQIMDEERLPPCVLISVVSPDLCGPAGYLRLSDMSRRVFSDPELVVA